jgi:hypothetical protein
MAGLGHPLAVQAHAPASDCFLRHRAGAVEASME